MYTSLCGSHCGAYMSVVSGFRSLMLVSMPALLRHMAGQKYSLAVLLSVIRGHLNMAANHGSTLDARCREREGFDRSQSPRKVRTGFSDTSCGLHLSSERTGIIRGGSGIDPPPDMSRPVYLRKS